MVGTTGGVRHERLERPARRACHERLDGLDLLRAAAIVAVMLFHSFVVGGLGPDGDALARYGWMGVDLFFVLSGFLIGRQVLESIRDTGRLPLADFYARRASRILPAYVVVLILYLGWPSFREAPGLEPAWKFLGFLLNLTIDYGRNAAFSHAWSLCVEEHFYLLFPVLAIAWARHRPRLSFVAVAVGLVLAGIALRSATLLHDRALDPDFARNWFVEDLYYPSWNRLDGLLAGVGLAAWQVQAPASWARARRHADLALLAGLAILSLAFWLFRDRTGLLANAIGWPVLAAAFALLVFAGAGRDSLIGRWRVPGAGALATMSYSLYLVHKPVYHLVQLAGVERLVGGGVAAFLAYGAAALAAGAVLHLAVERPFLRLRGRLSRALPRPLPA